MTNNPIKHHFVPQLLLKKFTNPNGFITVFNISTQKLFHGKPSEIGFIKNHNTLRLDNSNPNYEIEKLFAQIEGRASIVISKIEEGKFPISVSEINDLILLITIQILRSPTARSNFDEFHLRVNSLMESAQNVRDQYIEKYGSFTGREPVIYQPASDLIPRDELPSAKLNMHQASLKAMMIILQDIYSILHRMGWQLFKLDDSDNDLFLSDNPVTTRNPIHFDRRIGGIGRSGTVVIMPISPRVFIRGTHGQDRFVNGIHQAALGMSVLINQEILLNASSQIYGSSDLEHLFQNLPFDSDG